jgi:hypothetical protein
LLGLEPGEDNAALIEQRVHQRLDAVRRYQMMHPEQATEAMNRLAQAFVCLTEPAAKRLYDAALLGVPPAEPSLAPEPVPETRDPLAWLYSTEQASATATATAPPLLDVLPAEPDDATIPPTAPAPPPEPLDPVIEAARASPQARRGLATKRALYYRIARTRQLLGVWNRLGKYLAAPTRRLGRQSEAKDLVALMGEVESLLQGFPRLLGEAGQPGYLVIALVHVGDTLKSFQTLSPSQREALSRDWQNGQKLLLAHRDFLRQELRAMRKRSSMDRMVRAVRSFLNDHPGALLVLLALLALNLAIWRSNWQSLRPNQPEPPITPRQGDNLETPKR